MLLASFLYSFLFLPSSCLFLLWHKELLPNELFESILNNLNSQRIKVPYILFTKMNQQKQQQAFLSPRPKYTHTLQATQVVGESFLGTDLEVVNQLQD